MKLLARKRGNYRYVKLCEKFRFLKYAASASIFLFKVNVKCLQIETKLFD